MTKEAFYAFVDCCGDDILHGCGTVRLTEEQYAQQLSKPDSLWQCPKCGGAAEYNDTLSEEAQGVNDELEIEQPKTVDTTWTRAEAVLLAIEAEAVAPEFGCHVALTGGCLYRAGKRKDCDLLFYRVRQVEEIDVDGLFAALAKIGLVKVSGFGWCHKATYQGKPVDCLFPESKLIPKEDGGSGC